MEDLVIFFFEKGLPISFPGITNDIPAFSFPIWGNYTFIDFHLSNYHSMPNCKMYFIFHEKQKILASKLVLQLKKENVQVIILENGIHSLISLLQEEKTENFIFSSLSFTAFFDPYSIITTLLKKKEEVIKLSIEKVPIELYSVNNHLILELLNANIDKYSIEMDINDFIFNTILNSVFNNTIDIPGKLFFHNNAFQFYQNNLWLINNQFCTEYIKLLSNLSFLNQNNSNAYIGITGYIKNSIIGSGVEIHGIVDSSVIFSNTIVGKDSIIKNSVIMNNNRIDKECTIQNTIIFPYLNEMQNNYYNINEHSKIGGNASKIHNMDYPDHIINGMSLLGINVSTPKNFIIESGCYLGPNIAEKELKNIEKLVKGNSYL